MSTRKSKPATVVMMSANEMADLAARDLFSFLRGEAGSLIASLCQVVDGAPTLEECDQLIREAGNLTRHLSEVRDWLRE